MESKRQDTGKSASGNRRFPWLLLLLILIFVGSAYGFLNQLLDYTDSRKRQEELKEQVIEKQEQTEKPDAGQSVGGKKPGKREVPVKVNFEALKGNNSDVIGWLYIEALDISYPILQGADNQYYLHRNIDGAYEYSGSLFLDSENCMDFMDCNSIIYGHNMADGSMFGKLKQFNLADAISISPYVWVLTEEEDFRYEIFSAQVVTVASGCYTLFQEADSTFLEFMQRMKENSNISTAREAFMEENRVLTLSTCAGDGSEQDRYVVQAVR